MTRHTRRWKLERRAFLRGTGVAIALPWLDVMGTNAASYSRAGELSESEIPSRAVFTCWGLGMNPFSSVPEQVGLDYRLPASVRPLEPFRTETTFFTGLHAVTGGHQSAHCFLTGIDANTMGKYGYSCDQLIADSLNGKTRYPSLCLGWTRQTGFGGPGQHTLSWTKNRTPLMPENRPQVLFDRLFRPDSPDDVETQNRQAREQGSVLDAIREQARRLEGRLGAADRGKLQEYLSSIRDLEVQMAGDAHWLARPKPQVDAVDYAKAHMSWFKSMFDVMALALQTDSTRLITYNVRSDLGGYSTYKDDRLQSVPWDLHTITHNNGEEEKLEWWTKIDAWQMEEWVYFLRKLKSLREGTGTVLDHTIALWGTTNGGPAAHSKQDLPAIVTGGTKLGLTHAGHVRCDNQVPLGNLMRTVTERMGVKTDDAFYGGAHTGLIKEIA